MEHESELRLIPHDGLTFDDVLFIPGHSDVLPHKVDVTTQLTRGIRINIPLLAAAMDTVTEARLAISMAQEGGMGIIHRNLTPGRQVDEVRKVKRSESGMITDPVTIKPDQPVADALQIMKHHDISGVPVVDGGGKLVGILTNRDLRFHRDSTQTVSHLMTSKGLITAPLGTTVDEAKGLLHRHRIEKLPLVDERFRLVGLITVKDIAKQVRFPNSCKDENGRLRVGAAVGVGPLAVERAKELVQAGVDALVIDSAHGHHQGVLDTVEQLRQDFPGTQLIAGNIATREGAQALIDRGADAVKVGVGPGSICTTRIVTGCGVPQLTAISWAAQAAREADIPVIADGGIKFAGDIAKAIAAGATSVMIGSLFGGTEEAPGETVLFQGRTFKEYRGMGSIGAMKAGSGDRYFQGDEFEESALVPQGIEGRVPHKGPLAALIHQLIGGLRAGMGYVGAPDIPTLHRSVRFVRISVAGLRESHVHDVTITKEAPNYRGGDK